MLGVASQLLAARGESRSYEGSTQSIRRTTLTRMAMGTRETDQPPLWIATSDLPTSPGHPFYARLTTLLDGHHVDRFVGPSTYTGYSSSLDIAATNRQLPSDCSGATQRYFRFEPNPSNRGSTSRTWVPRSKAALEDPPIETGVMTSFVTQPAIIAQNEADRCPGLR